MEVGANVRHNLAMLDNIPSYRDNLDMPTSVQPADPTIQYVLPLRWSLHFALTESKWKKFRERHKKLHAEWEQCSCPKRCKADTLDEEWDYNRHTHTKSFVQAKFICRGCHWLKTPPLRIRTWLDLQSGALLKSTKTPHIVYCLGWPHARVDALREHDLSDHQAETTAQIRIATHIKTGQAAFLPAPVEQLSPQTIAEFAKPGQRLIVPWKVDLSALARFGFSAEEISEYTKAMYDIARQRMHPSEMNSSDANR
jgi:hypothetical protein